MTEPHWTSIVDTLNSVVQTVLIVIGFLFTYRQLRIWRVEYLGSKKIDVIVQFGQAALEIRDAYVRARNPVGYLSKEEREIENKLNQDVPEEEKSLRLRQRYWYKRLDIVDEAYSVLYKKHLECQLYGVSDVDPMMTEHNLLRTKFVKAIHHDIYNKVDIEKTLDLLYWNEQRSDMFSVELESITQRLLSIVRKHTA